jgi:hypothetical protein
MVIAVCPLNSLADETSQPLPLSISTFKGRPLFLRGETSKRVIWIPVWILENVQ